LRHAGSSPGTSSPELHAQRLGKQHHLKVGHATQAGLDVGDRAATDVEALARAAGRQGVLADAGAERSPPPSASSRSLVESERPETRRTIGNRPPCRHSNTLEINAFWCNPISGHFAGLLFDFFVRHPRRAKLIPLA